MSVEKNLPIVQEALWHRLGDRKHLQPGGLLNRLAAKTGLHEHEVRRVMARLREMDWLEGVASTGEPFARVIIKADRPVAPDPESLRRWNFALEQIDASPEDRDLLRDAHAALDGMEVADLATVARALLALRDMVQSDEARPQFLVSAHHLMSSSKMLGQLPVGVRYAIAPSLGALKEQIPYVVTAGPEAPIEIILIENPWAFELAVEAGIADRYGLIVTFGYGLSRDTDAYGRQLAGLVEARASELVQLTRFGAPPAIGAMLSNPNISFWGDLDLEGLRIYRRLKARIPHLKLSKLYGPMLARLEAGLGHPYVSATGKQGQMELRPDEFADDPEAQILAHACSSRGIDQECLDDKVMSAILN
ncbi:hypothetical protein G3580_18225 [Nitrogeniibacter mangrovi]|uniref:Wadjet protein JetD C-terminal domain-containing protein n=1 Tax=Nitrogeniibacter mangrovi TaxID=2016596 RepID=A0A6C1B6Q7_9RHOO|nr:Wadjet anti-phage system protein JetD domain-containing protein [Nitrogeniibacter mangrovi]QID19381.1 hypothetical protein G3580_18225 [Nitrogeniibacter mangrovi]